MAGAPTRLAVLTTAMLWAGAGALASDEPLPWVDEVRAGAAFSGDQGPVSDFVDVELLFRPLPSGPTYAPAWLLSPRPSIGAIVSTQGRTNELFGTLTWSAPVPGPFLFELSLGGVVHDQPLFVSYPDRPELSSRFMFRESLAVGYEINPQWRVLAFADHDSNGNLGSLNHGVNHIGVELGHKFGEPVAPPGPGLPAPAFHWGGAFFGVSGGVANGSHSVTVTPGSGVAPPDSGSLIIGGGIGYNWSVGNFVAGVEADYSAENIRTGTWTPASYPFHAASEGLGTARARVGVVVTQIPYLPWALVYATGGAAFSDISTTYCLPSPSCFASGPGPGRATETAFKGGWTAGGGIEFPVAPNVTTKIEALYADFGDARFQYAGAVYTIRSTEELVRAGINFRFAGN